MAGAKKIRQEVTKEFNWYGSVAVPRVMDSPQVYARVQSLRSRLVEESVLRVDAVIRAFIVGDVKHHIIPENEKPAIRRINKDVETTTFMKLRNVDSVRDIKSVRHKVNVNKVSFRGDRVSVIGDMTLVVTYLSSVVLEGTVVEFPKGSPVKGAAVKVKEINTGRLVSATTSGTDGSYAFAEMDPGTFMIEVEAENYQKEERVAVVMLKDNVDFILHRHVEEGIDANVKELKENLGTER